MTREEAIANLNMISVAFVEPVTKEQRKLIDDTFEMAIKALEQEPSRDMEEIREVMSCDADAETKCKIISNILTAKPHYFEKQEPKTGHWIGDNQAFYIYAKCSECGSVHDTATNYCPECGCLMDRTEFDEYVKTEGA